MSTNRRLTTRSNTSAFRRESGFTLIELMIVITILGLVAGWTLVAYTGVTEEQKLHAAARTFVGAYRELQATAARDRRDCVIEIDIEKNRWRKLVYPYTDVMGNWINSEGEILDPGEIEDWVDRRDWEELEKNILFRDVQAPGPSGNEVFDGNYSVRFRADGTIPSHMIHLATAGGYEMTIEIEEISGKLHVHEGYVDFYAPQEREFENLAAGEGTKK